MSLLTILQLVATFNFLFIGVLILLSGNRVNYVVKLLAVFLLAKGITLFTNLAFVENWEIDRSLLTILNSCLFLYAPFLYFFARSLASNSRITLKKDVYHFIPFLGYAAYNIINISYGIETFTSAIIIAVSYYIQAITYTLLSFKVLKSKTSINQQWIKNLLLAFLIVWVMFLSEMLASLTGSASLAPIFKTLGIIFLLVLANLTVVIAVYSPEVFFRGLRVFKNSTGENKLITQSNYNRVLTLMSDKKLFKNPDLKLVDLANELNFSERNTSSIIKKYHNGNFYDFLNSYRIEEAKRLFIEEQDLMTISEVLYEVGFNSKSVFNTHIQEKGRNDPQSIQKNKFEHIYRGVTRQAKNC